MEFPLYRNAVSQATQSSWSLLPVNELVPLHEPSLAQQPVVLHDQLILHVGIGCAQPESPTTNKNRDNFFILGDRIGIALSFLSQEAFSEFLAVSKAFAVAGLTIPGGIVRD